MTQFDDLTDSLICGDCVEVMRSFEINSIDAIVTDPPYGLEFMGKEWDRLIDKRNPQLSAKPELRGQTENPFISARVTFLAGRQAQLWHSRWLTEAFRVMKPGASMLVMGGARTFHRLACAIEDTGFIIKDTLMWIYGSGFPKAQDLGKMIKKRGGNGNEWNGFKVGGIKPAYEPIIWAVKPPEGSYIDNVLKWGAGAVNVDECRVGTEKPLRQNTKGREGLFGLGSRKAIGTINQGRFPANIILDEEAGKILDEQSGTLKSGELSPANKVKATTGWSGGSQANRIKSTFKSNSGGASRFFYCAKASRGERGENNNHPTVKPISLMSWLIKLVTRKGQIVLDPFLGSGTTGIAAHETDRKLIGIDRESEYIEIAKKRIKHFESQPQQMEICNE